MDLSLPPRRLANPARAGVRHATLIGMDRPPLPVAQPPAPAALDTETAETAETASDPPPDAQPVAETSSPPARHGRRPRNVALLFVAATAMLLVLAAVGRHHFSHAGATPASEAARLSTRREQAAIEAAALLTTQPPPAPTPPIAAPPADLPAAALPAPPVAPLVSAPAAPLAAPLAAPIIAPLFPPLDARPPRPEPSAIEATGPARSRRRESALPLPFSAIAIPSPSKAIGGRALAPIPDLIEGESPAPGDPLAGLEIEASLRFADAATAPFEVGHLRADGQRRKVELLTRAGDGSATSAWYEVGQSTPAGWTVIRIGDESVDLLTPRGNPTRLLPHPAVEPR
jgi:hypothetical protein